MDSMEAISWMLLRKCSLRNLFSYIKNVAFSYSQTFKNIGRLILSHMSEKVSMTNMRKQALHAFNTQNIFKCKN